MRLNNETRQDVRDTFNILFPGATQSVVGEMGDYSVESILVHTEKLEKHEIIQLAHLVGRLKENLQVKRSGTGLSVLIYPDFKHDIESEPTQLKDYEETYDRFFKEIIEYPDGSINMDQLKRELFDFRTMMSNSSQVFMHVSGGTISKPETASEEVIKAADKFYLEHQSPNPDYSLKDGDRVFVENSSGTFNYYLLVYDVQGAQWVLVAYEDKTFTKQKAVSGKAVVEPLSAFGCELVELVADFDFEELP